MLDWLGTALRALYVVKFRSEYGVAGCSRLSAALSWLPYAVITGLAHLDPEQCRAGQRALEQRRGYMGEACSGCHDAERYELVPVL